MQLVKNIFNILIAKERSKLVRLILLDVVMSLLDILFLAALLPVLQFYTSSGPDRLLVALPRWMVQQPLMLITCFFILFCLKNLLGIFIFKQQPWFIYTVASRLSRNNVANYLNGSFSNYVNIDSASYIRRISQQPIEFAHYLLGGLQQIISQSILILITILVILFYNPVLFPLLLAVIIPPVILAALFQKKKLRKVRNMITGTGKENIRYLQEALHGFVESNLFQCKEFFIRRYTGSQEQFNKFLAQQQVVQHLPSRLIEVFAVFGLFVLIWINRSFTGNSSIQLITLSAFMAAAYKIIPGIVKIINISGQIRTYEYTLTDLLKEKSIPDGPVQLLHSHIRNIRFEGVSFSYQNRPVLNNVSFTAKQGDFIGISGDSGKGKTTMIHLLLGFLSPACGSVLINNIPVNEVKLEEYWKKVSYVKQQPFFVHESAVTNVVLDNDYDPVRFRYAKSVSGFNTFTRDDASDAIHENGKNISGGQRQRISFARGLYKESDLLILDEPFSEMDEESEKAMLLELQAIAREGKIVLLITHNNQSLSYCSTIIRLPDEK